MALLLVSGCSVGGEDRVPPPRPSETPPDASARAACREWSRWLEDGEPQITRVAVTREVHRLASNSNVEQIDDLAELVFRTGRDGFTETWALNADALTRECRNLE